MRDIIYGCVLDKSSCLFSLGDPSGTDHSWLANIPADPVILSKNEEAQKEEFL